jgi:putative addiction module killer protein
MFLGLECKWLAKLADRQAQARILVRIDRPAMGNPGDVKPAGHGVSERRIDYGPGYRAYFVERDARITVLLCGGDNRTHHTDIKRAIAIAKDWAESGTPAGALSELPKPRERGTKSKERSKRK